MNGLTAIGRFRWWSTLLAALMVAAAAVVVWPAGVRAAGVVGAGAAASCTEAALDTALAAGGAVTFNCGDGSVTIRVSAIKTISNNTSIDGGGKVTISGGRSVRVFQVNQGVTLELRNVTVADGAAMEGGGIYVDRGVLNVANSTLANNKGPCCAPSAGGAIYNNSGTVTIDTSTVSGSYVGGSGAGLYNSNGSATITNSTFVGGGANSGGGVFNLGSAATLTITNSTFTGNGGSFGGALFNYRANLTVTNSTFSGNSASGLGGGSGSLSGGVIFNNGGTVVFGNSIAANSTAYANPGNCSGPINATGANNLSDDASCGSSFRQVASTNLKLGPLAANGGPTQTFALGAGSAAIDAGSASICALAQPSGPGGVDQRGAAHAGVCDIGAYERGFDTTTGLTSSLNPSSYGQTVTLTAQVTASSAAPAGVVTFKDGSATLGTGSLNAAGQATFSTADLAGGSHSITAVYGGDQSLSSNFTPSTSPALSQVVNTVTYSLTVSKTGSGAGAVTSSPVGINCGTDCSQDYDSGAAVTLTATPATDSIFAGWSGACANASGACSVTMDAAKSVTATFTLANRPPLADAGADQTVKEGSTVTLSANGSTDPDGDTLTFSWSVDGNTCPAVALQPNANVASPSFTASDNGVCVFRLTVSDGKGGSDTDDVVVTIENESPAVTIGAPSAGAVYAVGVPVTFQGSFTDAGAADTHTAQWMLDGTSVSGTVAESNGSGSVSGTYTFTSAGIYRVKLSVADDDGGVGEADTVNGLSAVVVVYDPNGGFVTGGGWINSPAGAYVADPTRSDKATFGFVSKYQTGAATPSGNTQFKMGNLKFKSTTYDWLVIAGAKAQVKGSGTLDGSGDYGFLLTAVDGKINGGDKSDTFRIKIWDKATGSIVYDNQMGDVEDATPTVAIQRGSIVIHK